MKSLLSITALLALLSPASGQSPIVGWNFRGGPEIFTSDTATFVASYSGTVAPAAVPVYGLDFDASATTLWAVDATTTEYGTIDIGTGAWTPLGFSTLPGISGLTAAVDGSTWYASYYDSTAGMTILYVGDVTTGVFVLVGPIGGGIHIDIAIDSNDNLYSHSISDDSIYSVNTTTGMGTLIGPTGLAANFAQGMDFDWSDDTLYAAIYTGGGTGMFCSMNLATGAPLTMENTVSLNAEMEIAVQVPAPTAGPLGMNDPGCVSVPNSIGTVPAVSLVGTGVAGDVVEATLTNGKPGEFGYWISGPNTGVIPAGCGFVCIGGPQYRYNNVAGGELFQFDAGGVSQNVSGGGPNTLATDGTGGGGGVPAIAVGETRSFQGWYRDAGCAMPNQAYNFSASTIVMFL